VKSTRKLRQGHFAEKASPLFHRRWSSLGLAWPRPKAKRVSTC